MKNHGLGDWIHRRRVRSHGETALISAAGVQTYDTLAQRIDQLANALADRGIGPGNRVAYLGENSPAFIETLFAVGSLGAVFVPLNTRLAPPEIQFLLRDSEAQLLVTSTLLKPLAADGCHETEVELVIIVEDGTRQDSEALDFSVSTEDFELVLGSGGRERPDVEVSHEDLAVILYTSGTTGNPKGAMLTHGNLTWNAINVLTDFDISSKDVALMIAPLFHVAALGQGALPVLLKGGCIILEQRFQPGRVLALIQEHRVTNLSGVPTTFQLLCEHADWEGTDISSLRNLTCGGSAVPLRVLKSYESRGLAFTMGYGMTETSPGATSLPPAYSRSKQGSGGISHFHTDVRVVDPTEQPCSTGEVGEIQVHGPNVIAEYWNRSEATATSFVHEGNATWLKTGDMGYFDTDGFLFISDRLKDMIISGGENIYPAQVEQQIAALEAVAAVAVIGVKDAKWGEAPRAVVEVREGYKLNEEEVLRHLDGKLARYKIPKSIVFAESMPRTASGKIRKTDLRKQHA